MSYFSSRHSAHRVPDDAPRVFNPHRNQPTIDQWAKAQVDRIVAVIRSGDYAVMNVPTGRRVNGEYVNDQQWAKVQEVLDA